MASDFDGIDDPDIDNYDGDRAPRLGLGEFLVEVTSMQMRKAIKKGTKYLDVGLTVLESSNPKHVVDSAACVQIWYSAFPKYALKRIKELIEAALPGKQVTAKLCDTIVEEGLLEGAKLRVTVKNNSQGYPDNEYSVA